MFPELVLEGSDPDKTLSVDYQALIPLLVNALQVQHEEIRQLREEFQQMRTQMNKTR